MIFPPKTVRRKAFLAAMGASLFILLDVSGAQALDSSDVKNLIRNRVPEETIINIVKADGTIFVTLEEADEFRAMGASENLVTALRPTPTSAPPIGTPVSAPPAAIQTLEAGQAVVAVPASPPAAYPPRQDKEGWLAISNHDWIPYYVSVNVGDKRIFISRHGAGGAPVESGQSIALALRKEEYRLYGDSGRDLKIKIREGETTTLSFTPFGLAGNSGMTGVATDRERTRSETLFDMYTPPPAVIVQEPAPIIIQEAPVYVVPGPPPYYYHRPPPPFFRHRGRRGGGGLYFQFGR
ncbi:MAG: hypothetical protein LBE84_02010 [Planctomycetota bacterium]|nr:hypothetical protein [Planctomycetota bacterium]